MTKLTSEDILYLQTTGQTEADILKIEEAMQTCYTQYYLDSIKITLQKAIRLLGRSAFLDGIRKSTFQYQARQPVKNTNCYVIFKSDDYRRKELLYGK